ncbi:hypothetical protein CVT25_008540 [Psilocybe cyanescens]|uniref:Uncharacterized protein n=1 Tax=Psilocybe cyanescens TaxID=93625 RepID=A0A409X9R5_PSICY|nr:hypothetical protein CVT25_008540 [Psilocybe cyanescens]
MAVIYEPLSLVFLRSQYLPVFNTKLLIILDGMASPQDECFSDSQHLDPLYSPLPQHPERPDHSKAPNADRPYNGNLPKIL